jgi:hypothetical protein
VPLHNFDAAGRGRRLARRLRRSRRLYDLSGLRTVAARSVLGSAIFFGKGDITRVIHEEPAFSDDAAKPRHAPDLPECVTWVSTSLAFGFQRHPIHPLGCAPPGCRGHQDFALRCHRPRKAQRSCGCRARHARLTDSFRRGSPSSNDLRSKSGGRLSRRPIFEANKIDPGDEEAVRWAGPSRAVPFDARDRVAQTPLRCYSRVVADIAQR